MKNPWKGGLRWQVWRGFQALAEVCGCELTRSPRVEDTFTMPGLLARAKRFVPHIETVIDVGASDGSWSRAAQKSFGEAKFLLVEPLLERRADLEKFAAQDPRCIPEFCALGAHAGTAQFHVADDLDGSGLMAGESGKVSERARLVPVHTLDEIVAKHGLRGPFLLKLDTHGFEVPIFSGSAETLAQTDLIIVEVYNFQIAECALQFPAMCTFLEERGFRCCDLADPMARKRDGAFWQMDLAFLRTSHPIWLSNQFL